MLKYFNQMSSCFHLLPSKNRDEATIRNVMLNVGNEQIDDQCTGLLSLPSLSRKKCHTTGKSYGLQ